MNTAVVGVVGGRHRATSGSHQEEGTSRVSGESTAPKEAGEHSQDGRQQQDKRRHSGEVASVEIEGPLRGQDQHQPRPHARQHCHLRGRGEVESVCVWGGGGDEI